MKYREYEIVLEKGSTLFLYTDGLPEATNADNAMFSIERLLKTLNMHRDANPVNLLNDIKNAVDEFVGDAEQFDDLTMLGLKYLG